MEPREDICTRFFSKVATDGCWEWQAQRDAKGYGRLQVNDRNRLAHQIAYELFVGPIPEGLELDHLCRNPSCVNPDHLEAVTHRENVLRGVSPPARSAVASKCLNGHPWSTENTGYRNGVRFCRPCARARNSQYRRRKRLERKAA